MNTIKSTIYSTLNAISGVKVILSTQSTPSSFPTVAYAISDNQNTVDLDGNHVAQLTEIVIDVFGTSSTSASTTIGKVDDKLRAIGFHQTFMQDVPDPDAEIYHINARYTGTI